MCVVSVLFTIYSTYSLDGLVIIKKALATFLDTQKQWPPFSVFARGATKRGLHLFFFPCGSRAHSFLWTRRPLLNEELEQLLVHCLGSDASALRQGLGVNRTVQNHKVVWRGSPGSYTVNTQLDGATHLCFCTYILSWWWKNWWLHSQLNYKTYSAKISLTAAANCTKTEDDQKHPHLPFVDCTQLLPVDAEQAASSIDHLSVQFEWHHHDR